MLLIGPGAPEKRFTSIRSYLKTPLKEGVLIRVKCRCEKDTKGREATPFSDIITSNPNHLTARIELEKDIVVIALGRISSFNEVRRGMSPPNIMIVKDAGLLQRLIPSILKRMETEYLKTPGKSDPSSKIHAAQHYCIDDHRGLTRSGLPIPEGAIAFSNAVGPLSRLSGLLAFFKGYTEFQYIHIGEGNVWRTEEEDNGICYDFSHHQVLVKVAPDRGIALSEDTGAFLKRLGFPSTLGGLANLLRCYEAWRHMCGKDSVRTEIETISRVEGLVCPDPKEEETRPGMRKDSTLPPG
jgi:hypothetical protein